MLRVFAGVAALVLVALAVWLAPPQPYVDRLAVIPESHVDNTMYESLSWEPDSTQGGLYSLNAARVPYFISKWRAHNNPGAVRMLDLGCGGGIATLPLAQEGFAMTGIDDSARSVERAQRAADAAHLPAHFVVGSVYALPFANASFDGLVCSDVIEHLHDLRQFAAEAFRVLRPGGTMVFDTINRSWLSHAIAIQLLQRTLGEPPPGTHDWRMFVTPDEAERLFADAGFEVGPRSEWRGISPVRVRDWRAVIHDLARLRVRLINVEFAASHDLSIGYLGWVRKPLHESAGSAP